MVMFYLISVFTITVLIFFTGVADLSRMRDSHSMGASNLTKHRENSSYKNTTLPRVRFPERMGKPCAKKEIVVNQGATTPMPNGIQKYTAEIVNVCVTGCSMAKIHVSCGWFSSARMINPKLFKRLDFSDCLVNDGKPLKSGGSISFQYANPFKYPMVVSSVKCVP